MTKPSRLREKGFAASSGGSFLVESAESRAKRISDSLLMLPSVPTHSAAGRSPRRIDSTPSWIAEAPEAQAVVSVIGEPVQPYFSASRSASVPFRNMRCQGSVTSLPPSPSPRP